MTSPESASPSRPAKAAGFALLGVAAVALVIGVISLFDWGSDTPPAAEGSSTAPPAQTTSAPASESSAAPTSAPPSSSSAASTPPTSTTTAPGTSTSAAAPPPPVTPPGTTKVPVRVYNNSTITGLAGKAADDVRTNGWTVAETGNYSQGTIPTTTVYFRPGTEEEASAKELAAVLRARVEPRFDGIQSSAPGIILIVTNDYQGAAKSK
ncbi:LytR cell envelope-related transcriptional attenuator [Lentzea xinjiangensis]|uniref:LytR cell envelope-related transcriptional attenuator n=1 Tax=Lentzea xinjiangensis TaxID=402600 RepID=A0A1H9EKQ4_9PSEU|nr:LytR C-terminal domain-containing protein [Lentzea xinjiangensis]SEQ26261.1 LytR cell envelope-related transcriptional attenuator [Lentzea xinjiangensis]